MENQIVLVRHGQTAWSLADQHTGRTDIPLTERGEQEATLVGPTLAGWQFAHAFSSPLQRARLTAERSGLAEPITLLDDLLEWDYGIYEGRRTVDIVVEEPGWSKWAGPVPNGEEVHAVGDRADRAIDVVAGAAKDGPVAVFAHGHLLAVLIARLLGLSAVEGKRFVLDTATVTVLGMKRGDRVLRLMNHRCGEGPITP
jgi:broad specificity phosphatase PhoE